MGLKKPFEPEKVAQIMNQDSEKPLMVVTAYSNYQDIALGWSFALALKNIRENNNQPSYFGFYKKHPDWLAIWQKLPHIESKDLSQLNLWVIAPGIIRQEYPLKAQVSPALACDIDPTQHYRIGIPYQLYRCTQRKNHAPA